MMGMENNKWEETGMELIDEFMEESVKLGRY